MSALDVLVQNQILTTRRHSWASYLFITHDLAVVRQIADDVIVMEKARLPSHLTDELFTNPVEDYTRELIEPSSAANIPASTCEQLTHGRAECRGASPLLFSRAPRVFRLLCAPHGVPDRCARPTGVPGRCVFPR